jgi:copper chaperone CopZ
MIRKNVLTGLFIVAVTAASIWAAEPHKGHGQKTHNDDPVLATGEYSARVKAMVCEGCAPLVEKSLRRLDQIGPVHVDTKASRVHFSVKEGKTVKSSAIHASLKKSAEQMGMGADFSLSDFQMGQAKPAANKPDKQLSAGYYEANVGGIVCGGCKDLIEKTMRAVEGVGAAQVDEESGTVKFAVMKDKTVHLSKLQSSLKIAADQMGMGAAYSLSDVKPLKKAE